MYRVSRRFEFDSAHRLLGYSGPCANLHGHHYVVDVTVVGDELSELGMLIDFGDLKKVVWEWLEANWDHNTLLNPYDSLLGRVGKAKAMNASNPTAENMGRELFEALKERMPEGVVLENIRLYETPDCWVEYNGK
ncbi:MAG: 6-carboxytetrahydropterin synthase QueD [Candidatus Methanospirareceae archaeon]